jgi:hypothetical protein
MIKQLLLVCGMWLVATAVTCARDVSGPRLPILVVTTVTTGTNVDTNGYLVTLDPGSVEAMPIVLAVNDSLTIGIRAGTHLVLLSDVATNCSVSGNNPATVVVKSGSVAHITLRVVCAASEVVTSSANSSIGLRGSRSTAERFEYARPDVNPASNPSGHEFLSGLDC